MLSAAILVLRARLRLREARWRTFVERWRPALLEAILEPHASTTLPRLAPSERTLFLRLWAYLHESVRGEAATRLNELARELGIDTTARHLMQHGDRAQRLQAVLDAPGRFDPGGFALAFGDPRRQASSWLAMSVLDGEGRPRL